MSLYSYDLEITKINGYTFENPKLLEGVDNVAVAHGQRNRDGLKVIAKLSYNTLRLEREYHTLSRLYNTTDAKQLLCQPIDKISLSNGLVVLIFADYGFNLLQKYQPAPMICTELSTQPLNKPQPQHIDLATFLDFAIQCCNCLELVHKNQIVHGEIRVNAFLWPEKDVVKIWNFGFGARTLEANLTSEGWRKAVHRNGTFNFWQMLVYMSPEQTGRTSFQPDHRTDLYSLGITFFVVLTQSMPFVHHSPMELIHSVLNRKIPAVHQVRTDVPVIISNIIEKLTNKSPDERYSSVHGLRQDLKECQRQFLESSGTQTIYPFPLGKSDIASVFTLPSTCFGRYHEIQAITAIIRRTAYLCGHVSRRMRINTSVEAIRLHDPDEIKDKSLFKVNGIRKSSSSDLCSHWKRPTEIVAIHGSAGVGKSTLLRTVQQVAREYGYVAVTKFDKRQPTPYGCILRCMSILFKNIMVESPTEINNFSQMLKEQLNPFTISQLPSLLVDNVPELLAILGEAPKDPMFRECDVSGNEIKMRFHSASFEIFQVLTRFKFVTLFLEDLHQADDASIELLESFISTKLNCLVVVTYRDDELSPLATALLHNENSIVSDIKLENFDQKTLMDFVRTAMHRFQEIDTVLLMPLVDFVYKKTHGNPFYASQLLATLEKKGLIYFTWDQHRWEYNLPEIEKALLQGMGEKNADIDVGFLVHRLKELPRDGRAFVKWAAFIGDHFSFEAVRCLMEDWEQEESASEMDSDDGKGDSPGSPSQNDEENGAVHQKTDAINGLQSAIQLGFIVAFSNDEFGFSHDRYSQAAMMLTDPEKREILHLKIASHFMDIPGTNAFWVADQVKAAIHLIKAFDKKAKYRALLIQAGDKAYASGAHHLAWSYYQNAQLLLSVDPWVDGHDSNYLETLHLYTRLSELSWFMGYDSTPRLLKNILSNAKSAIDRAPAYRIQHRIHFSRKEHQKKSHILLECLYELGIERIDLDLSDKELHEIYKGIRNEVMRLGLDKMSEIPVCESRLIRARFAILEELCLWAYWMNDLKAILAIGARLVIMTLKHGSSPTTGVGLVFFGIAAMQLFKAYEFGQQIGEIGLNLCDKHGGTSESARARYLYGAFLSSWKYHYRDSLPMFRHSLKQSLLGGDRTYAAFSHVHIIMGMLLGGEHLSDTLREAQSCLDEIQRWTESTGATVLVTTIIRMILALQGKTLLTEEGIFEDEDFQEKPFIAEMYEQNPDSGLPMYWYFALKLIVLVLYGFDEAAYKIGQKHALLADMQPSHRHTHLMLFFHCLAMIRLIRKGRGDEQAFLSQIQKHRDTLAEWARHSPINIQMFVSLIDAELSSLSTDNRNTQRLYDLAIEQAIAGGWGLERSIMYEFAGDYYTRTGAKHVGTLLIEKAIAGYRHLGSYGKATQLEKKYNSASSLKSPKNMETQTDTQVVSPRRDSFGDLSLSEPYAVNMTMGDDASPEETLLTLDVVDLASILKSSQIISSEMNFELLMEQMLGIILENSGADSGLIIIKENTSFLIMGRGSQNEGCEILKKPKLLSEEAETSVARVAQYAIHIQDSLFIADVQQDSRFSNEGAAPKSIICVPIKHKSTIVGCIAIEGSVGTLTARHEVVLRLLSQQIGISVTNALLFKSIQKVTKANHKMIENQKAALEEARMSKEAALRAMKLKADFLANMSHELRTPFSGFYGMISLLSETSLDAEQLDIVHTAKECCEKLLRIINDLLNFSKLEAGKVVLDVGPLVVEEVIADTIEILSSLAARKGIELAYIVDSNVPETVAGDSSRLRQILTNLLGNAIKFTHEGSVVINCKLEEELEDDFVRLKYEVIDTGIGISREQQRNLFEPFSQVDGSTTRMYGGTGLGLSICLQLVRLMKGQIGVISEPNKGSNFWFSVVVKKVKQEIEDIRRTPGPTVCQSRILLASQQDATANMLYSLLPDLQIKRALDTKHAISQALQERHDILLLDIPSTPNSYISQQLQSVDDDPECDLHIILLYTPATEGHKVAAEATNSASDRRGRTVKMAKPARRIKLLRALEQVTSHPKVPGAYPLPTTQIVTAPSSPSGKMTSQFDSHELAWFQGKPVLIAEDNMVAQKLLRKQLEKMGFVVESANNGDEAVRLWQQRSPHYYYLGFFDHHMPKCDGVEATKQIRQIEAKDETRRAARLPIIALTADVQATAREVCVNAGMDGYLTKPLIAEQLASLLRKLCPIGMNGNKAEPNNASSYTTSCSS